MLKEVIDSLKFTNYRYSINDEKELFQEQVRGFFEANDIAERVKYLIGSQFIKLRTKCLLAYDGKDTTKDMPYPNEENIDMMINTIQQEINDIFPDLDNQRLRVLYLTIVTKAEEIYTGSSDSVRYDGIKTMIDDLFDNQRKELIKKKDS